MTILKVDKYFIGLYLGLFFRCLPYAVFAGFVYGFIRKLPVFIKKLKKGVK